MLIGYFLCSLCAQQIFKASERLPNVPIPLHGVIEHLITAYQRHLASQDALDRSQELSTRAFCGSEGVMHTLFTPKLALRWTALSAVSPPARR